MAESKVIIVTGASRGIGHAMAKYLISSPEKYRVVITARTAGPLQDLKNEAPDRVEITTGDFGSDPDMPQKTVDAAVSAFGRLDGLILNHGALGEVNRIVNTSVDGWVKTFQINFFSFVGTVKAAIPHLRKTKGRIIMCSSGVSVGAYATWGAYASSKAAMNQFARQVANEEPDIITMAIRPGVVDTEMQREVREEHAENMDKENRDKFVGMHREGKLLKPEQPGHVMAKLAVAAGKDFSGQFLNFDDSSLAEFQSSFL